MARTNEGTNVLAQVVLWVAVIGALNWGLVGIFNWDLVRAILGGETATQASAASRALYAIVGIAGLVLAFLAPRLRSPRATSDVGTRVEARA
jgi:hypothetical protein